MSNHYYELNVTSTEKKVLEHVALYAVGSYGPRVETESIIERCEHNINLEEDNCMEECEPDDA